MEKGDDGADDELRPREAVGEGAQLLDAEGLGEGGVVQGQADLFPGFSAGDLVWTRPLAMLERTGGTLSTRSSAVLSGRPEDQRRVSSTSWPTRQHRPEGSRDTSSGDHNLHGDSSSVSALPPGKAAWPEKLRSPVARMVMTTRRSPRRSA